MKVKFLLAHPDAKQPTKSHKNDAGFDLYCIADDSFSSSKHLSYRFYTLGPGEIKKFETGLKTSFEKGYAALLWDRSSLGVKGVHRLAGVIDSEYLNTWSVVLVNHSKENVVIKEGDRICQAIFTSVPEVEWEQVDSFEETSRGEGGFGSTGA